MSEATDGAVLILGAGWLGSDLAVRLARGGAAVVATNRSGSASVESEAIRWAAYDSERDGVARLVELLPEAGAVVVCWAPSRRDVDRRRHYVGGAEAIIEACERRPPRRLVYASSTSALPARDGELDESCEEWPADERGRIQRAAEVVVRAGCERSGIPWFILRLAGLYGPGRELERIYRWTDGVPLSGDGAAATNLVHRDDVCRAIITALNQPPQTCGVVHVCDDDHSTRREIFAALATRQHRPPPLWELPPAAARGKRVANRRLKELLGGELLHPRHRP